VRREEGRKGGGEERRKWARVFEGRIVPSYRRSTMRHSSGTVTQRRADDATCSCHSMGKCSFILFSVTPNPGHDEAHDSCQGSRNGEKCNDIGKSSHHSLTGSSHSVVWPMPRPEHQGNQDTANH